MFPGVEYISGILLCLQFSLFYQVCNLCGFFHVKDIFITNPRWQCWFNSSSISPLMVRCEWCKSSRFLVSVNAKVFKALNIISHWIDQLSKDWRSEFILAADTAGLESTFSMRQASSTYNQMTHAKFITMYDIMKCCLHFYYTQEYLYWKKRDEKKAQYNLSPLLCYASRHNLSRE